MRRPMQQTASADQMLSAVRLLHNDKHDALVDEELMLRLDGLLTALALELEADRESIPKTVRGAALKLADYIVCSSIPVPSGRSGANAPTMHDDRADHVSEALTTPSRLTRMG